MSNKDSDSGSQTSSQRDTIEHQDLAPEDSASQCESSMSRASCAARRAAAEVQIRVARQKAAKELRIAEIQQEVAELEAEGETDALDAGDEVFEQVLSNTDAPSQRSTPESRGVNHWAPEGHMRRVQVEETRTSCMVVCGPSGGSVDSSSSVQSPLIPTRLFRDGEGDSRTMVAEMSRIARSDETTRPEPPCVTKDTEEGRKSSTKAWDAEAAAQDIAWKFDEELPYQDQDVRLKQPEQANSHVTPASQRRSELSMDLHPRRRLSVAS